MTSKYKISSTHCSCIAAPLRWHFVQLDIQQTRYSGLLSVIWRRKKNGKYMIKNLTFISQWMEYFCWFGCLNQLGKYGCVHSIAFLTHWKENSSTHCPPPLRKFTSFRSPYPLEFLWPSLGGVWIFSGTTHSAEVLRWQTFCRAFLLWTEGVCEKYFLSLTCRWKAMQAQNISWPWNNSTAFNAK